MVCKAQLVTFFLVVISFALVVAKGKECGDNPMKQVLLVAKRTGRSLDHVLMVLRDIDTPAYETLARRFRMYAACVGLVDTGYFRKRSTPVGRSPQAVQEEAAYREKKSESNWPASHERVAAGGGDDWPSDDDAGFDAHAGTSGSISSAVRSGSSGSQLADDAADVLRSIVALYAKGKQLVDDERRSEERQANADDQFPELMFSTYNRADY